ncbi:MAG: hypothetical protein DI535_07630 [Citrobacter freundii]|nr:MAG: hypothetical protein DI535_07630 [Citrobacter freundii]
MQNLTAKKIIEFKRLPPTRKQTFVNNLKKPIIKSDSGGDYWISCVSAITNACKSNNSKIIADKIDFLQAQYKASPFKRTKDMYQRNIDILSGYKDYDFTKLKPKRITDFLTRPNPKHILTIKSLSVQVFPNHVFSYKNDNSDEVGAIWFVAQLNGFKNDELQIFTELLYKYLSANYSKKRSINSNFCIAVDVVTKKEIKYSKIESSRENSALDATLADLKTFLK